MVLFIAGLLGAYVSTYGIYMSTADTDLAKPFAWVVLTVWSMFIAMTSCMAAIKKREAEQCVL